MWCGETREINGRPWLTQGEVVTITDISPDGKLCFIMVTSGTEYGWLAINEFVLIAPYVVPMFNANDIECEILFN